MAWLIGSPSALITVPVIRPSGCVGSLVCANARGPESRRRMPVANQDERMHELFLSCLVYKEEVCVQTVQAVNSGLQTSPPVALAPSRSTRRSIAQNKGNGQANYYQHTQDYERQSHGQEIISEPAQICTIGASFAQAERA